MYTGYALSFITKYKYAVIQADINNVHKQISATFPRAVVADCPDTTARTCKSDSGRLLADYTGA